MKSLYQMENRTMNRTGYAITFIIVFGSLALAQQTEKKEQQDSKKEATQSQEQQQKKVGQKFIDLDGDGFNDQAPDEDGDGIPNSLDPDWQKQKNQEFVDLDGDGINDNMMQQNTGQKRQMLGPGEGIQDPKGSPQVKSTEQKRKGKQREK
jgi:hypothetical protein